MEAALTRTRISPIPISGTGTSSSRTSSTPRYTAAFIVEGSVEIDGRAYEAGRMLVFTPGDTVQFTAITPCTIMLVGGEPLGKRFIEWNFVSSSQERIAQAKSDWRAGRMKLPDLDHDEFIPLPGDAP